MKVAICQLRSASPYSQSKMHKTEKLSKELNDAYEERTWRERMHYNPKTRQVFIPASHFSSAVKDAASRMGIQIPGKGKSTYTKSFMTGVMVLEDLPLPITLDEVVGDWVPVPSNTGNPKSGTRVDKCFGVIQQWEGTVTFHILDDIITADVFEQVIRYAGLLVGIGRYRPLSSGSGRGGTYGRFSLEDMQWLEQ